MTAILNNTDDALAEAHTLTDVDILLAHSIHFTWGYPDYVRHAFRILQSLSCDYLPSDPNTEMTWKQLRKALETADTHSVRYLVAGNPDTPLNVLDFLAKGKDAEVCRRVAENPRTHAATLTRLSRHPESSVRMAVCENPHTVESVLHYLTNDVSADVRYTMAENANTPLAILQVLTGDENPYVCERATQTLNRISGGEVVVADFSRVAAAPRRLERNAQ